MVRTPVVNFMGDYVKLPFPQLSLHTHTHTHTHIQTDVVDDIPTVKFAFIQWLGESVKPMAKAKISTFKGTMEDIFKVRPFISSDILSTGFPLVSPYSHYSPAMLY